MTRKLNETAGGGAIGSGGIATRTDGPGVTKSEGKSLKDFLAGFNSRVVNRFKYSMVPFPIKVTESFDLQDVLSRLTGIEGRDSVSPSDNVTYGVEDAEGNVMKVTVKKDQGSEFETVLAHELAEIEAFTAAGSSGKDISMAELLFNLKDKFDIIDVSFPKIPTDVVYNADKASYKATDDLPSDDQVSMDGDDMEGLDDPTDPNAVMDLDGMDDEEVGDELGDGDMELPDGEDDLSMDAEGVEEFSEPTDAVGSEGSILDKVLDMLKAQAEAQTAAAQADAEKYRAEQAEYSAKAASATVAQEEEMARMEAGLAKQKDAEKQSKKLADIAKYRVQQASGMAMNEAEEGETTQMIRRMMTQLPQKWLIGPDDDAKTAAYKNLQKSNAMRELQARMRTARAREIRAAEMRKHDSNVDPSKDNINQRQQQNQQGQQGQQDGSGNTGNSPVR